MPKGTPIIENAPATDVFSHVKTINGGESNISFQIVSEGFDAADAEFFVEESNDGTNFVLSNNQDPIMVIPSGDDVNKINVIEIKARFYRINYTPGSNAAGTFDVIMP